MNHAKELTSYQRSQIRTQYRSGSRALTLARKYGLRVTDIIEIIESGGGES